MKIGELCNRDIVSVAAGTPLSEVARLMCERHVGSVVVTTALADGLLAIGMITDRDITRAQLRLGGDLSRLASEDVMTREPLTLSEDESLETALARLRARGVRRAPVTTPRGLLAGLVSIDDVVGQLARELAGLARLLHLQPVRERSGSDAAGLTIVADNVVPLRYSPPDGCGRYSEE